MNGIGIERDRIERDISISGRIERRQIERCRGNNDRYIFDILKRSHFERLE
jgi:hypothetical protein